MPALGFLEAFEETFSRQDRYEFSVSHCTATMRDLFEQEMSMQNSIDDARVPRTRRPSRATGSVRVPTGRSAAPMMEAACSSI